MEVGGAQASRVRRVVGLGESKICEMSVEVLHVRNVTTETDNGGIGKWTETLDVGEAGQRAV